MQNLIGFIASNFLPKVNFVCIIERHSENYANSNENYTVEISEHDQIFKDVACRGSLSSSACVVSSLSTTASLTALCPWTTYNIRVFARNKIGRSNSSPILNVTTDEAGMLLTL